MTDPDAPITTVSSKIVYQNKWIKIHEDKTMLPGNKEGLYAYLESNDSANIIAIDDKDRVCLVRQFRYPSQSWGWESPAGGNDGQDSIDAARRELEEETGIRADNMEALGKALVSCGLMVERQHMFVAYGLHVGEAHVDDDETISGMQFFSFEEIDKMIERGEVRDNQTISALYLAKQWLAKREK